jgi:flagellar motor switch protein FliM
MKYFELYCTIQLEIGIGRECNFIACHIPDLTIEKTRELCFDEMDKQMRL